MNEICRTRFNCAVVIPALNPIPGMVDFVQQLLERGVAHIIVVNDGSDCSLDGIFEKLEHFSSCSVLKHKINMGKGRALKTAFSYFLRYFPYLNGVVTADADGQHSVEDVCKVCGELSQKEKSLILGVRNFKSHNVPKTSYIGNLITSLIFYWLYGTYLNDTQTGLRGIPSGELAWMEDLGGERYDYEINMLIKALRKGISFKAMPIKTLYFNNNSGSHYKIIKDSAHIFKCLISGLRN